MRVPTIRLPTYEDRLERDRQETRVWGSVQACAVVAILIGGQFMHAILITWPGAVSRGHAVMALIGLVVGSGAFGYAWASGLKDRWLEWRFMRAARRY
jgi:hypothetical protein